ncbi:hypothetical protein CPHO_09080 [Corynebacterium phocae]|uniref:DUF3800 domain-containing protein n=1 Tax=Corynebacterium phocae TaxID=161895 RepID=A0A1L7D510_9CORY|nr:DUF3800 domain-containing protein [Corynebacterium phocae]APT93012.1 hypothetical protein CPHO_09080 [Corynebacterium phocae]KAA8722499.1 DUF3800 domain-containing protein [Corynebacterium phocae]
MWIGYFDEFGHNGAYISRADQRFKTHPVFGIGGIILPADNVRRLSGEFRKIKELGLKAEIDAKVRAKGKRVEHWEKKGASLLTTNNVKRYQEVRYMINRLLNLLDHLDAKVIFYGQEKPRGTNLETGEDENSRYDHAMKQLIQRVNWSIPEYENHMMILDKQGPKERMAIFASTAAFMFSNRDADKLLEPPLEVESHLYQTVQCADWICALLGRISAYKYDPDFNEFKWAVQYFGDRLEKVCSHNSKIRASNGGKDVHEHQLRQFSTCFGTD